VIGLDSNALLRWLAADALPPEDASQVEAVERLLAASEEPVFVSLVVLAETVWTLKDRMRQSRAEIVVAVGALLDEPRVALAEAGAVAEARDAYAAGGAGFADHLLGALAAQAGCRTTFTFDKRAAKGPHFTLFA
jgi:predicted nucleic-acid-binding protein